MPDDLPPHGSFTLAALADGLRMFGLSVPAAWSGRNDASVSQSEVEQDLYCGQLVDAVYLKVTNSSVLSGQVLAPVPAAFSADDLLFEEAVVSWP